jgi:hypothetical protein
VPQTVRHTCTGCPSFAASVPYIIGRQPGLGPVTALPSTDPAPVAEVAGLLGIYPPRAYILVTTNPSFLRQKPRPRSQLTYVDCRQSIPHTSYRGAVCDMWPLLHSIQHPPRPFVGISFEGWMPGLPPFWRAPPDANCRSWQGVVLNKQRNIALRCAGSAGRMRLFRFSRLKASC